MTAIGSRSASTRRAAFIVMGALAIVGVIASQVRAREPPEEEWTAARARSVGPHSFSLFNLIESPFVATRVMSRTGAGIDQFTLSGLEPDPETELEGEFATINQVFQLGIHALDWLGFEVEVLAGGLVGADGVGALFVGANGGGWLRLAAVAQLVRTDVVLVSARLDLNALGALGIAPSRVVDAFEDDGGRPTRVSSIDPGVSANFGGIRGSVVAAVSANAWLGFMGSVFVEGRRWRSTTSRRTKGTSPARPGYRSTSRRSTCPCRSSPAFA